MFSAILQIMLVWPDGHLSRFSPSWLKERSFRKESRERRDMMSRRRKVKKIMF